MQLLVTVKLNNMLFQMIIEKQKVDASIVYDALEVSFNSVDKNTLQIHNVDILHSINHKGSSNDVYTKTDVDIG